MHPIMFLSLSPIWQSLFLGQGNNANLIFLGYLKGFELISKRNRIILSFRFWNIAFCGNQLMGVRKKRRCNCSAQMMETENHRHGNDIDFRLQISKGFGNVLKTSFLVEPVWLPVSGSTA